MHMNKQNTRLNQLEAIKTLPLFRLKLSKLKMVFILGAKLSYRLGFLEHFKCYARLKLLRINSSLLDSNLLVELNITYSYTLTSGLNSWGILYYVLFSRSVF